MLSPEQLAEIHRVGAEMDGLRPDIIALRHQANLAGQDAVEVERAKKAEVKAQKKAEAAERKNRKVEAVALRRATDIVFLGRGVSGRLGDRTSDVQKLTSLGLPLLSTPADVAAALGLTIPQLRWLAFQCFGPPATRDGTIYLLPDAPHVHPRILGGGRSAKYAGDLTVRGGRIVLA